MKVLMISTDRKVFDQNSEVRQRMRDYANFVDKLWVAVVGGGTTEIVEGKLKILGLSRWRALFWRPAAAFDLVTSQDPFENGFIAWRLARRLGAKLQFQIHTDFLSPYFWRESFKNKIRVLLARFLLPRAAGIRVVSRRISEKLKARAVVLPIFVDLNQIKNAPIQTDLHRKYPQFEKIILMASRLTREKNIGLAIEAMAEVVKRYPRAGLLIVGSGPEKTKYHSSQNIIFEDWTDDLVSYYKTADLFLLTSNYEGYGRTLVEAAAAGCQVISTDVGIAREILPPENIIPVNDAVVLAEKIILVLEGKLVSPQELAPRSQKSYLQAYKVAWEQCLN
jgi:glycosyltransferase involved in cell wall biosynthesis